MEAPSPQHEDERQSQLKLLIAKGKEQGYLTYGEVNDHLPSDIVDPEQIEDIVNMINDMGITVYEKASDAESQILSDNAVSNDDDAADEAAAALATVDSEFGRTTDPVRMYMREMGTVELLTREGEIRIAKRIEEGLDQVRAALAQFPPTFELLLGNYDLVAQGEARLQDLIVGFIDPNEEIANPQARSSDDDDNDTPADTGPDPAEVDKKVKKIKRLAKRYRKMLERFDDPALKEAVAKGYHKLLAYKDEYEVARLLTETINRIISVFPPHQQAQIRARLAGRKPARQAVQVLGQFAIDVLVHSVLLSHGCCRVS